MITANELRLGNIISDQNGFEMYVVGVFDDEILLDFDGNEGDVFQYSKKEIELLKPVKITEELLKSIGGTKFSNSAYWLNYKLKNGFAISQCLTTEPVVGFKKKDSWYYENDLILIESLHQLQNLFYALTGKELITKEQ